MFSDTLESSCLIEPGGGTQTSKKTRKWKHLAVNEEQTKVKPEITQTRSTNGDEFDP